MDLRARMKSTIHDHQARRPGCHAPGGAHQQGKGPIVGMDGMGVLIIDVPCPSSPSRRTTTPQPPLTRFSLYLVSRPHGSSTMSAFQTGALLHSRLPRKHKRPATTPIAVESHHTTRTSIRPPRPNHQETSMGVGKLGGGAASSARARGTGAAYPLLPSPSELGARSDRSDRLDAPDATAAAKPHHRLLVPGGHRRGRAGIRKRDLGTYACVHWCVTT